MKTILKVIIGFFSLFITYIIGRIILIIGLLSVMVYYSSTKEDQKEMIQTLKIIREERGIITDGIKNAWQTTHFNSEGIYKGSNEDLFILDSIEFNKKMNKDFEKREKEGSKLSKEVRNNRK